MASVHQVSTGRVGAQSGAHPADARLREAYLRMARALPKRPHWSFHEVATRTDRAPVYQGTVRAIDCVIEAGAPLEDALAFVSELEAYVRLRYVRDGARPMSCLLLEEARADAEADVAQSEALASPSLSTLQRVVETGERQVERLREILYTARHQFFVQRAAATKMPRLALARAGRGEVRHSEASPNGRG